MSMLDGHGERFKFNQSLIDDWLNTSGISKSSAKTYDKCVRLFFEYLIQTDTITPTLDTVSSWIENLKAEGKSTATINLYLVSVKLFFKFLNCNGLSNIDLSSFKCHKINQSIHKKDALTSDQGKIILKSFDTTSTQGLRDRAMVALMMCCGLRTIEIRRANVADITKIQGKTILFVQGKGKTQKADCVMVPAQVEEMLNSYLEARGTVDPTAPLFASLQHQNQGGRLATGSISRIVKTAFRANHLDSKRLTAHSLRHSAATAMLLAGVPLIEIQRVLRHTSLESSLMYLHSNSLEFISSPIGESAAANSFISDEESFCK